MAETGAPVFWLISTMSLVWSKCPCVTRICVAPSRGGVRVLAFHHRVAVDPRVDQQDLAADLDAETAVAEPDDLHDVLPWLPDRTLA